MNYTEYTRKKAVGGIVSLAKTDSDMAIMYDEYDQDTGAKSTSEAHIDLDHLQEQMTQMNAEIQHTSDRLTKLTANRNNLMAMIADVEKVVMGDVIKS